MLGLLVREQRALFLAGLAVIFVFVFWPTLASLHIRWMNPEEPYSSSYFVVAMAVYLIWKQTRNTPLSLTPLRWWALALITLPSVFVWYAGYVTQTLLVTQAILPVILFSWILIIMGWPIAKKAILPLLLCYMVVPVWGVLGTSLRLMTVTAVEFGLGAMDIPAFIDGFQIHLPAGVVEVAGGCSGQNYLISGLIIGGFYAINYLSGYSRLLCVLLVGAISILANWVRVFLLVLIGHYTELTHPLMKEHNNFGWVIFAIALAVFFVVVRLLESRSFLLQLSPVAKAQHDKSIDYRKLLVTAVLVLIVSAGMPLLAYQASRIDAAQGVRIALPDNLAYKRLSALGWLPNYQGYDLAQQWVGKVTGENTEITALVYTQQVQGKELIYGENQLVAPLQMQDSGTVKTKNGRTLGYSTVTISNQLRHIYWIYRVGDSYAHSGYKAKLLQIPANLSATPQAALITFSTVCLSKCDQAPDTGYINELDSILDGIVWSSSGSGSAN